MIAPRGRQFWAMLHYVGRPLILLAAYDVAVVIAYKVLHWEWLALPHIPISLFGSAIGIILGFRNQSAYARWWEGRTLWGAIVNHSRSWGRQVMTAMLSASPADAEQVRTIQQRLIHLQIAYVHALRQQLRGLDPLTEIASLMTASELEALRAEKNVAIAIQQRMGQLLRQAEAQSWIDPMHWLSLSGTLNDLTNAQGGAERIKNTPMPKQYDYFPQLFVQMFCLLLPLSLVPNLGWFTPLGSTLAGFIFLALDEIGRDLENPFENLIFDLPLTSITTTIEINLRQMLGETTLPAPVQPVRGVIW